MINKVMYVFPDGIIQIEQNNAFGFITAKIEQLNGIAPSPSQINKLLEKNILFEITTRISLCHYSIVVSTPRLLDFYSSSSL
jgi:hypothetical protein